MHINYVATTNIKKFRVVIEGVTRLAATPTCRSKQKGTERWQRREGPTEILAMCLSASDSVVSVLIVSSQLKIIFIFKKNLKKKNVWR